MQARCVVGDQLINGGDDENYSENQSAPLYTEYVQSGCQLEVPTTALEPQLLVNMLTSPAEAPRVLGGLEEFLAAIVIVALKQCLGQQYTKLGPLSYSFWPYWHQNLTVVHFAQRRWSWLP